MGFPLFLIHLFDLANDPGETKDLAVQPPAEAPVDSLRDLLGEEGTFESIAEQRAKDRERTDRPPSVSKGALQYQLADGRVIAAEAGLYGGEDLKG